MKKLSTIFLLLITLSVCAQKTNPATASFVVKGDLIHELTFSSAELAKYQQKTIDENAISAYKAAGNSAEEMKGVLLKDILKGQQYKEKSPKAQTSYTITLKNAQGETLVYSWNELFNSNMGDSTYIITAIDEKDFKDIAERVLLITSAKSSAGNTFIKNLSEIIIAK